MNDLKWKYVYSAEDTPTEEIAFRLTAELDAVLSTEWEAHDEKIFTNEIPSHSCELFYSLYQEDPAHKIIVVFESMSIFQQKDLLMNLKDIFKANYDKLFKEVKVYSNAKDISAKIKEETGFDCRWIMDMEHTIGTNIVIIPAELWSEPLAEAIKHRYDLHGDYSAEAFDCIMYHKRIAQLQ